MLEIQSTHKYNFESINLYFQDESRLGLITNQKRVLSVVGVNPVGTYQHSYKYLWLWGSFSPITGDNFMIETSHVNADIFEIYLEEFSKQNPKELKVLIIDNAGFHSLKNITIPENIILINIPPYSPELNPAEKVWQWMKSQIAMKIYPTTEHLQNKITEMVRDLTKSRVKSITGYEFYLNTFNGIFKGRNGITPSPSLYLLVSKVGMELIPSLIISF